MSVSANIRSLASDGLSTSEIARRLGISYQHAYNVLKTSDMLPASRVGPTEALHVPTLARDVANPALLAQDLMKGGFELSGRWILSESGDLAIDRPLPQVAGIYAFAKGEIVVYVGLATMGIAKRLHFYRKPSATQRTNPRIHHAL